MDFMEACAAYRKAVQEYEEAKRSVEQAQQTVSVMKDREHLAHIKISDARRDMEEAARA
jgi:hypothetical protein